MNILFDFTDEELEYIIDRLNNNEPKSIDRKILYEKIDSNMENFLKTYNTTEKFQNFKKDLNKNQFQVFRYIIEMSSIKIPNEFYSTQK